MIFLSRGERSGKEGENGILISSNVHWETEKKIRTKPLKLCFVCVSLNYNLKLVNLRDCRIYTFHRLNSLILIVLFIEFVYWCHRRCLRFWIDLVQYLPADIESVC